MSVLGIGSVQVWMGLHEVSSHHSGLLLSRVNGAGMQQFPVLGCFLLCQHCTIPRRTNMVIISCPERERLHNFCCSIFFIVILVNILLSVSYCHSLQSNTGKENICRARCYTCTTMSIDLT